MYRAPAALCLSLVIWILAGCQASSASAPVEEGPLEVVIDHLNVPTFVLNDEGAELLRLQIIAKLRVAGIAVVDSVPGTTWGSFLNAMNSPVERPTLLVSLNMVPDGSTFIVNFFLKEPVLLAGSDDETTVITYATHSYAYSTRWRDHSPVLNYLADDVIARLQAEGGP